MSDIHGDSTGPNAPDLGRWIEHLRRIAAPHADPDADLRLGAMEAPFRAAVCGAAPTPTPDPVPRGECGAWWAIVDERIEARSLLAPPGDSFLLPRDTYRGIEAWTDAELSTLHALWRRRGTLMDRLDAARRWHLEHTQPDNATNRPWALHVFLVMGTPEATHYAETLLHNSMALTGHPDPLSAWILLDAARELAAQG